MLRGCGRRKKLRAKKAEGKKAESEKRGAAEETVTPFPVAGPRSDTKAPQKEPSTLSTPAR